MPGRFRALTSGESVPCGCPAHGGPPHAPPEPPTAPPTDKIRHCPPHTEPARTRLALDATARTFLRRRGRPPGHAACCDGRIQQYRSPSPNPWEQVAHPAEPEPVRLDRNTSRPRQPYAPHTPRPTTPPVPAAPLTAHEAPSRTAHELSGRKTPPAAPRRVRARSRTYTPHTRPHPQRNGRPTVPVECRRRRKPEWCNRGRLNWTGAQAISHSPQCRTAA
jgi:hypothetical protein